MNFTTQVIDGGTPFENFKSYIKSYHSFVSYVKFGWGSSIIDPEIKDKINLLNQFEINFNPGGTLFEYFYSKGKLNEYEDLPLDWQPQPYQAYLLLCIAYHPL